MTNAAETRDEKNPAILDDEKLTEILSKHGYELVEQSDIAKWEVGVSIAGVFGEIRKAGKGYLLDYTSLDDSTLLLCAGCPTILRNRLRGFEKGQKFAARCVRMINTPNGEAYDFEVYRLKK